MPAEPVHGGETDLVARVVADEDGGAAAKRLFLHELADAHALVFPCGTHLDDVLAALDAELASDDGKHGPGQPVRVGRSTRRAGTAWRVIVPPAPRRSRPYWPATGSRACGNSRSISATARPLINATAPPVSRYSRSSERQRSSLTCTPAGVSAKSTSVPSRSKK